MLPSALLSVHEGPFKSMTLDECAKESEQEATRSKEEVVLMATVFS